MSSLSVSSNLIGIGDSELLLSRLPDASVNLVFTSPPYYNARPEYAEYASYADYLSKMERVIQSCHRVLSEGRFFVLNVSPVLIPRPCRSKSSKRLALPFDFHAIFIRNGFDFIDDIIWVKPQGAGCGRGRNFSVCRSPLQYKPVPVTEYVLVYRKHTERLIDWNIRSYSPEISEASKIGDGYEVTNVWKLNPASSRLHPAVFPQGLAERVIRYYSFVNDLVLDPFSGIGTTGLACLSLNRRFALFERKREYMDVFIQRLSEYPDIAYDMLDSTTEAEKQPDTL